MKIPPYIKKEDIKKTAKLGNYIRTTQGISAYLFFKRLATVAMYGEIENGKITYYEFLTDVKYYLKSYHDIFRMWGYDKVMKDTVDTTYFVNKSTIRYGTQTEVEKDIVRYILYAPTWMLRMEKRNMIDL